MYTVATPLGRLVSIEDWEAYQGDVVLGMLYDYFAALENDFPLSLKTIVNGTTLNLDDAMALCHQLEKHGLVSYNKSDHSLKLTRQGLGFVEGARARDG